MVRKIRNKTVHLFFFLQKKKLTIHFFSFFLYRLKLFFYFFNFLFTGSGNFKCPAGSDPAVKIILGHTKGGADIFMKFGKTTDKLMKKKSICKSPKGYFKLGSGTDPYKSAFTLLQATKVLNEKLLNKKVVRAMGYVKGLMCVHKRPRMQILINDVVMPNLWGGANANKWSIEPGCVDEDGSRGKGGITYKGKDIDPLNKYSNYGTCSTKGKDLGKFFLVLV